MFRVSSDRQAAEPPAVPSAEFLARKGRERTRSVHHQKSTQEGVPAASSLARVLACFQTLVAMCEEISGWDGSACGQAEGNRNPAQPAPGNARKHQAGQRPGSGLELDEVCTHTSSPLTSAVRSTAGTFA